MPATTISTVWEHFEVFDNKSFTCKVDECGQHFNPPLRSTTAMRHLSRRHPDVHIIVCFMEQARKDGIKKEEVSVDENEPDAKKNHCEAKSNEKAKPNIDPNARVLQASSTENVQMASPSGFPPAQSEGAKNKRKMAQHKAMPNEAPTTSKEAKSMSEKEVRKAMTAVEQPDGPAAKVKRKSAVEAEKRIAHINDWLRQVRKEQKIVRAKRTTIHKSIKENDEEDDVSWPVDLILDERWIDGKRQVLLRWTDYDANADTWEPVEHLTGAAELLSAFDTDMDDGFGEETMADEYEDKEFI